MCLKGALNCSLDGKALRCGEPLGKSLGFLREIDHAHNLAQLAVKSPEIHGLQPRRCGKPQIKILSTSSSVTSSARRS